jgi:toxin secretion/phage lysis holin
MSQEEIGVQAKEWLSKMQENSPELHWTTQLISDYIQAFPFIGILILLMMLDIASGIIAAAINREIDSNFSFKGALKKAQMLLMVAAGLVFEMIYPDVPWGRIIAGLLSLGEMISITENAGKAGLPIPVQLKETLKRLRSAEKEDSHPAKVQFDIHADKVVVPEEPGPGSGINLHQEPRKSP